MISLTVVFLFVGFVECAWEDETGEKQFFVTRESCGITGAVGGRIHLMILEQCRNVIVY